MRVDLLPLLIQVVREIRDSGGVVIPTRIDGVSLCTILSQLDEDRRSFPDRPILEALGWDQGIRVCEAVGLVRWIISRQKPEV